MIRAHPIAACWFFIALCVGSAVLFDAHQYPLLISEGGIVESLSVFGYLACVAVMFYRGGMDFAKRYHYLIILITLFGLRELDFDKRFTTMGILKSRFYTSDTVPLGEKLIGLVIIGILLYVVFRIIKDHAAPFVAGVRNKVLQHLGSLSAIALLVFSKSIDGLDRKLASMGITVDPMVATYFGTIEEVLELGIPVLILATFALYLANQKPHDSRYGRSL